MSDAQPQPVPVGMPAPAAPPRAGSAVGGFFVDLAIAVVVMLAVSFAAFAGWGVLRAIQVAMQGEVDPGDTDALMQAIGQPGGVAMIWVTLLGTGTAALVPYVFRRRASAAERA
ncbi:MAG TPA: CPBP family intramembrane glutamate endopeptidase, partial [Pseudoxanthomonas sp.]|nr:CPBP family intramembrane glutamate endopeptidase [Pseudoxanthomonas sp.]